MTDGYVLNDEEYGKRLSYAAIIRDVFFAHTVIMPFFEGFTARRSKQLPSEPYHLPYLGVYFISDRRRSDGNWNHGSIDFEQDITLGWSVQMQDNDPLILENKLHCACRVLDEGLWPDQYLVNMLDTYNPHTGTMHPENMRIEGVSALRVDINLGLVGKNETPFGELQYEPTFKLRTIWPPYIRDDLLMVHVETAPMVGKTNAMHPPDTDVKRIITRYEFQPSG